VHLLYRSLRVRVVGDEPLEELRRRHGAICYCAWHAVMIGPLYHHRHTDGYALVSEHEDGELIARVLKRIGYTVARGSTTHGGVRGLMRIVQAVRAGHELGVCPDGPLGPRYVAQPGVVFVAQKSGCPIVPMGFASSRYWEFNSWDRFRLPKPWSRAEIRYGEPIHVPSELTEDEVEVFRRRVEEGLKEVTRQAEASVGLPPEQLGPDRGE